MMNVKLSAGIALLIRSGMLLVSVNIKLAYALQNLVNLESGWWYASWNLQQPNVKPTQDGRSPVTSQCKTAAY
jgi:hypothetical protein